MALAGGHQSGTLGVITVGVITPGVIPAQHRGVGNNHSLSLFSQKKCVFSRGNYLARPLSLKY